jgi:hypothetical protein
MSLTHKQNSILTLIKKNNQTVFSPEDIYKAQGDNPVFSQKAVTIHLCTLARDFNNVVSRVKKGQYMLTESIPKISVTMPTNTATEQVSNKVLIEHLSSTESLPAFLAHEDIDKLIEWKNSSIQMTSEKIENLKLKINKLEKQKDQLKNIKNKFC